MKFHLFLLFLIVVHRILLSEKRINFVLVLGHHTNHDLAPFVERDGVVQVVVPEHLDAEVPSQDVEVLDPKSTLHLPPRTLDLLRVDVDHLFLKVALILERVVTGCLELIHRNLDCTSLLRWGELDGLALDEVLRVVHPVMLEPLDHVEPLYADQQSVKIVVPA